MAANGEHDGAAMSWPPAAPSEPRAKALSRAGVEDDPQEASSLPAVLTADELAALLRVDRKTVYAAFRAGELPGGRRIGGTIRFSRDAVLRWLEEGRGPAQGGRPPGASLRRGQAGVSPARKGV
jgi:excisionase family DNA binding protein